MPPSTRITNGNELAAALGVVARQLREYRTRGLPLPSLGESVKAWAPRAKAWVRANRKRSGPKVVPNSDRAKLAHWDWRWRKARAEREELDLAIARGEVHSHRLCEHEDTPRYEELRAFFRQLPDRLARQLYQAPSPEAIKAVTAEHIDMAFGQFARARRGVRRRIAAAMRAMVAPPAAWNPPPSSQAEPEASSRLDGAAERRTP